MSASVSGRSTVRSCRFGPLTVEYDDQVLEPRPWTLLQSARAARRLGASPGGPVVELHCGAGHIGQAVAAWTGRPLVQCDDDATCCAWAARNARRNGLRSLVVLACGDTEPVRPGRAALVLADPPYVPSAQVRCFPDDPVHAIDGGADGLDGVRACLPSAARMLRAGGALVLQVRGPRQAAAVVSRAALDPAFAPVDVTTVSPTRALVELVRR